MCRHKVGVIEVCALRWCEVFVFSSAGIVSLEHTIEQLDIIRICLVLDVTVFPPSCGVA